MVERILIAFNNSELMDGYMDGPKGLFMNGQLDNYLDL